ncbi:CBS domain-containing protein [Ensifer sp. HO-A22]|uniref:CBS domain-containing protein n=1 Tax=Ensifer oleiphilus TaxID=2742698 RepID=A0A7Y6Q686_9HYPH|nr:CBS domain-containing protein [Ensifer oleiphilus]NVD39823.1 CBS domain-containing protein [Ensifer oleiphilus]
MRAADIMTRTVITISPDHSVRHAARLMLDNHISGLPVCDDEGVLVGMLSEGDLLRRAELGSAALGKKETSLSTQVAEAYIKGYGWRVGDVMTQGSLTVGTDTPVGQIAELMAKRAIKRVPVVADGRIVGIVSRRDILELITAAEPERSASGDEAIKCAVQARLASDLGLDRNLIEVRVDRGVVSLCGTIESGVKRLAARVAAEAVDGVGCVRNELRIAHETERASPKPKP